MAAGATLHLVRPLGFSLDDRYLRRAGLDYWQHLDPVVWPSWSAFEATLSDLGPAFFFSSEAEAVLWDTPLWNAGSWDSGSRDTDFGSTTGRRAPVLIFGSETNGLAAAIRQRYAERLLAIPMRPGPVRSLNLSTSAAIAIFEARRQLAAAGKDPAGATARVRP